MIKHEYDDVEKTVTIKDDHYLKLEIRSVERGICPIATSTMNEVFL